MKVLITGGHLGPALAVIEELDQKNQIIFVGRKYASNKEKTVSLEYREIEKRKIPFYNLTAGRLTRIASLGSLEHIFKIPLGFYQALLILKKEKPDLILSFGGYIAFPICFLGYILKIPIFIHEQTIHPGISNRLSGFFAKKIFVSFKESAKFFPESKTIVSGNPVRKAVLRIIKKVFDLKKGLPIIYITGGSIGSHNVNLHVEHILDKLLEKYIIIHQTGNIRQYGDFERLKIFKNKLPIEKRENYFLKDHFLDDELGYIYSQADIVVGRSGANTFFEILAWKKPSVLIPLPWSASGEQLKHAELIKSAGTGEIFNQSNDSDKLLILINKIIKDKEKYINNFKNLQKLYQQNAASVIVKSISQAR
ncbi:UDP-N-acetylglucosamine--N-acetylmuramyl-(pentapeptide) pyrophosphoryl-undecaprenol N-acetylglucosamine transferase [Candidatus Roizmanbacteria bacterium]|nr:UDP-N-acetylglucosamine--N-acetylmuramyl-(pentapeptide) pyrophosphoryl-undecaprenol N-acetylglucosamine transferase [Candidatus Roizmanbacteria bacterium]